MDMERCSRDAMDPNLRHKLRLISEEELPSWLLRGDDEVRQLRRKREISVSHFLSLPLCPSQIEQLEYEANEERLFGRGSRARKTVDYSEMLTEREWLKVCVCMCACVRMCVCVTCTSLFSSSHPPYPSSIPLGS